MSTYIRYSERKVSPRTLELIQQADRIVQKYEKQGLTLSLRQLYYQLVTEKVLPNAVESYNRLGRAVNQGRLVGLLSWTSIEDRTRGLRGLETMSRPGQALERAANSYRRDLWEGQPYRPEVWVEKDALTNVIEGICNELRVDFFACRGYTSQSEAWRAGQRFQEYIVRGQRPIVFHLGDHDPSGIDMTRDNRERLELFCGVPVMVVRLALNRDQIEQYALPPDPAKELDPRHAEYIERHGRGSWELDALEPATLRELIRGAVTKIRDEILWDAALNRENSDIRTLHDMIEDLE